MVEQRGDTNSLCYGLFMPFDLLLQLLWGKPQTAKGSSSGDPSAKSPKDQPAYSDREESFLETSGILQPVEYPGRPEK